MKIVTTIADLRRLTGDDVGFVPTMGAFHEGHLQLMRTARNNHESVVVSLFVNPTQFGKNEDFSRYPRNLTADAEMAEAQGVDIMFAPEVAEMYADSPTSIHVPEVSDRWEGAHRPGHFDGVATVVAKLFHIVRPHTAYFGRKDLQQCLVIRKMVRDLNIPVILSFEPTIRTENGLALSSRNAYLSPEERAIAPKIFETLTGIAERVTRESLTTEEMDRILSDGRIYLERSGFVPDYLEWVDFSTMAPLRNASEPGAIIFAGRLGTTRLIDNVILRSEFAF